MTAAAPHPSFFYTHTEHPKLTGYPLHTAVHNGREQRVLAYLDADSEQDTNNHYCVYQLANDAAQETAASTLCIALARRQRAIAELLLDVCQADLAFIEAHFAALGICSAFWLHERILVAYGADHVDLVRQATAATTSPAILADPASMAVDGPLPQRRRGLIVLLKTNNRQCVGVAWLSARAAGADRSIAALIGRIYERGGELFGVRRREHRAAGVFDVAARMGLPEQWLRMYRMFGCGEDKKASLAVWSRRECVRNFRQMAERADADKQGEHFEDLCRRLGGFEASDLFDDGLQTAVNYLHDAIVDYRTDATLFEHLMELATRGTGRTATELLAQSVLDDGRLLNLFEMALYVSHEPDGLPTQMLKYRPSLASVSASEFWDSATHRLVTQVPFSPEAHALLVDQWPALQAHDGELYADEYLLESLAGSGWMETVRWMYARDAGLKSIHRQTVVDIMARLTWSKKYAEIAYLLDEHEAFDADEIGRLFFEIVVNNRRVDVPDELWTRLVQNVDVRSVHFADMLAVCLDSMHLPYYRRLIEWMRATLGDEEVPLKDIITSRGENLLFGAIWNRIRIEIPTYPVPIETESPEIVDADDDAASAAHKTALNARRVPAAIDYSYKYERDAELELAYTQLFDELLAAGVDVHHRNEAGQNLAHLAVRCDNAAALRRLRDECGVDVSLEDNDGQLPMLHVRSAAVFEQLPAADVRCVSRRGNETILIAYPWLVPYPEQDYELMERFVAAGCPVGQAESTGETALHRATTGRLTQALLDAGADPNAATRDTGDTALLVAMGASWEGAQRMERVRALLAHPAIDVGHCNRAGVSLFTLLAQLSEADFAEVRGMLGEERFAEVTTVVHRVAPTQERCSILAFTQQPMGDQNLWCLRALLETAELCVEPTRFREPAGIAPDGGRWLLECGAHVTQRRCKRPLDWPAKLSAAAPHSGMRDWLAQLDAFIGAGCELELRNLAGETALQCYCRQDDGSLERQLVLCRLLAAGADYRVLRADEQGRVTGRALDGTVFESLYEWDDDGANGLGILHQAFRPRFDLYDINGGFDEVDDSAEAAAGETDDGSQEKEMRD